VCPTVSSAVSSADAARSCFSRQFWTTDIGGFADGNTEDPDFRELIVRWFQWGAFCPLFRLHGIRTGPAWPPGDSGICGQTASNEVWMFGDAAEAAIVKVMRMREQLRPYIMEQYRAASRSGTPVSCARQRRMARLAHHCTQRASHNLCARVVM
jgi:alpha-glucosidase (family GH31 glycosyl hydrolase)